MESSKEIIELPKFSFSLPVYNEEERIARCLKSILNQDYPKGKIEILVIDGCSTDRTKEIASQFECVKIFDNPKKLADFGAKISIGKATGELFVIFAADNELVGENWLKTVAKVFLDTPDLSALWCKIVYSDNDPALNKYYTLIQNDPLSFFVNKNLEYYLKQAERKLVNGNYAYIFNILPEKPLIWGANGLVYRTNRIKNIIIREKFIGDNDAFQIMIESGFNKIAYLPQLHIYHHHVEKISDWIKKWERNYMLHFLTKRKERNLNWAFPKNFKIRLLTWIIYSGIPIFSFFDSIYKAIKYKTIYWLYHPLVNLVQLITYLRLTLLTKEGIEFLKRDFLKL